MITSLFVGGCSAAPRKCFSKSGLGLSLCFLFLIGLPAREIQAQETFKDQIAVYDRDDIHSIHKRLFTKEGRHELSLHAGGIFNHGGYAIGIAQYQYHFFEALGLEAAAGGYGGQFGDDNTLAFYQASLSFSPIYGKISWFTWAVLNFDLYGIGGLGAVKYDGLTSGSSLMGNIGLGSRVFITEWLNAKVEFRDYIYSRNLPNSESDIWHNYALTAGLSVMFPFRQED